MEARGRASPFPSSTLPFANSLKYFSPTEVREAHLETKGDGGHPAGDSIIPGETPLEAQQGSLQNLLVLI